jgi:hypothetical protein
MWSRNKAFFLIQLFGASIVATVFILACRRWGYTDRNRLSLAVVAAIYLFWCSQLNARWFGGPTIEQQIPSLGVKWVSLNLYTWISLGIIICGYVYWWPFQILLIAHLCMLLLVAIGLSAGRFTVEHVDHIEEQRSAAIDDVIAIRRNANQLVILAQTLPGTLTEVKGRVIKHAEEVEYLSGATNPEAKPHNRFILEQQYVLESVLRGSQLDAAPVLSLLNDLSLRVKMRKACQT